MNVRWLVPALLVFLSLATSVSTAATEVTYEVTVSKRVDGKWIPTGETTTYKSFAEALRAVSRINVDPDRMASYTKHEVAAPEKPPSFVGAWIPEGETKRGDGRTGAPGVVREQITIQANGTAVHHDVYYGMVRCKAQIDGKTISLSHDKGWGGRDARWTFSGMLEGDKIVGTSQYVDSGGQARQVTYVRQQSSSANKSVKPKRSQRTP